MGGVAGLLFSFVCVRVLVGMIPVGGGGAPVSLDVTPDVRLLGFTLAVSFATGILFGLAPALESIGPDPVTTLRAETGSTGSRARGSLRKALVVLQVALSCCFWWAPAFSSAAWGISMRSTQASAGSEL
jgi:hypothetical protein